MDAYEESYFTPAPDTSKHSHLCLEELEITIPDNLSPPSTSTSLVGIPRTHFIMIIL